MCKRCKHEWGSTRHLLYWQKEWFKRFVLTWYHIVNRKAYHRWRDKQDEKRAFLEDLKFANSIFAVDDDSWRDR